MKKNSLQNKAPDIAALWHPIRNKTLTPEFVSVASSKRVWWKGTCGHEWQSPVAYEVLSGKCPYCTGKRILKGFNDLASQKPTIASQWNNQKNINLKPDEVTVGSGKRVWWICEKGHEWQATGIMRTRANHPTGCPVCGKLKQAAARQKTILKNGVKPLSQTHPELALELQKKKEVRGTNV